MKVMGVGNAAREHAIAEALKKSSHEPRIFWVGDIRNPGIHGICEETGGEFVVSKTTDRFQVADHADKWGVDFVVVGPEEPNFFGIPDELDERGIPCIGANRAVAIIEMSKAELRRLQWKYDIPGKLLFRTFRTAEEAYKELEKYSETLTWLQNVALKPARQAGGKGVKVIEDRQIYLHDEKRRFKAEHTRWLEEYMGGYRDIEDKILVEEKVWGPEYTLQCFTDGRCVKGMPLVQDNKNAHEFDIGTETGGMGSISGPGMLLPFITEEEYKKSLGIVESIIKAIQREAGRKYHGVVAGQMMLTELEGPTIIEMYSRFGDPEALNVLPIMETDFVDVCEAIMDERLNKIDLQFQENATVVKAIAPKGYPEYRDKAKGHPIKADERAVEERGCSLYWASADLKDDGSIVTGGSRVVEILAVSEDLEEASRRIEDCIGYVELIDGWDTYHRSDIGTSELIEKRLDIAERVRRLYKYREEREILGRRLDWLPGVGMVDPTETMPS